MANDKPFSAVIKPSTQGFPIPTWKDWANELKAAILASPNSAYLRALFYLNYETLHQLKDYNHAAFSRLKQLFAEQSATFNRIAENIPQQNLSSRHTA
jgi:hypothetical protein